MTRFWLLVIGVVCLVGAGALWGLGDPWARASVKSAEDAQAIHRIRHQSDQIGFLLSKDPALLKAVVWSQTGSVLYPGPRAYVPTRFDLSVDDLDDLTRRTAERFQANWSAHDGQGTQLLYCQPAPRMCLIYDRGELQAALGLSLNGVRRGLAGVLTGMGLLCLLLCWRRAAAVKTQESLVLLPAQHSARRGKLEIALTPRDVRLLAFLQARQGEVVTKDELYDAGWGRDFMPNSRALDQHIINLRKKLDPDRSRPPVIETVRGVGYRLV